MIDIQDFYFNPFLCSSVSSYFTGLESSQTIWEQSTAAFNFRGRYTQVISAGELSYIGTEMDNKFQKCSNQDNSNYLISLRVVVKDGSIVSLKGRKNNNQYIQLKLDTVSKTISIYQFDGTETLLDCQKYSFNSYDRALDLSLIMIENRIFGMLDSAPVVSCTTDFNHDYYGASILVDAVPTKKMILLHFYSYPVIPFIDPQFEGSEFLTNLYVQYRKQILDVQNNPEGLDWDSFKLAYLYYTRCQGIGLTEMQWTNEGYPLRIPRTERFLNPPEGPC